MARRDTPRDPAPRAMPVAKKTPVRTAAAKPEPQLLFQRFFHSVGPRTYWSQVKKLANGNHSLVLTEERRDPQTGEARQTRLVVYGEDFSAFFKMLHETAGFIRENPLPPDVRKRRNEFWARKAASQKS